VFDHANQVVRDLTREDFKVFDDGRLQELTVFQNTFQPISAVLMVDTSASMALTLDLAREAAEQFLVRLSPGDKVRVGSFSDTVQLSDTFTDDRDWLLRWLRNDLHIGNPNPPLGRPQQHADRTCRPRRAPRRRAAHRRRRHSQRLSSPARSSERAKAEGVMVYAVQIRSRSRPGMEFDIAGPGRPGLSTVPTTVIPPSQTLRELAEHTGGAYFTARPPRRRERHVHGSGVRTALPIRARVYAATARRQAAQHRGPAQRPAVDRPIETLLCSDESRDELG
jgi:hypothetical protein